MSLDKREVNNTFLNIGLCYCFYSLISLSNSLLLKSPKGKYLLYSRDVIFSGCMLNCNEIKALLGPAAHIYIVMWICLTCLFSFASSVMLRVWHPELCSSPCLCYSSSHTSPTVTTAAFKAAPTVDLRWKKCWRYSVMWCCCGIMGGTGLSLNRK